MTVDFRAAYTSAYLIRHLEQEVARRYSQGKMRCPTHLSIGQEIPAVAVCAALAPGDRVFSNHRCHAHYLAKGGDPVALVAELYGKATGCCGGRGGSMHLAAPEVGFMGTSAVVGSAVPLAVGSALGTQLAGGNQRTAVFFGDAALESGQLYEAVNFAALRGLPLLFVCEDNGYATQTPISQRQPRRSFAHVAAAMGIGWTHRCKDDDFTEVFGLARAALGHLPAYLEIGTYRWYEHVGPNMDNELGYRSAQEVLENVWRDPVARLAESLGEDARRAVEAAVHGVVADAFAKAEAAPWPEGEPCSTAKP